MLERLSDPQFWTLLVGFVAAGLAAAVGALELIVPAERIGNAGFAVRRRERR